MRVGYGHCSWRGCQNGQSCATRPTGREADELAPAEGERWQFDRDVTDIFLTNMLARSIPQYGTMRDLVFDLGATLVQPRARQLLISGARRVMPSSHSSEGSVGLTITSVSI